MKKVISSIFLFFILSTVGSASLIVLFPYPPPQQTSVLPSDIPGLQLWLDSTDASTINSGSPSNGDNVTAWRDKSGNSNNYTGTGSAGGFPTYVTGGFGGKPTMNIVDGHEWFTGGTTNYFTTVTGYSVYFIMSPSSVSVSAIAQLAYLDQPNTVLFLILNATHINSQGGAGSGAWSSPQYTSPATILSTDSAYAFFAAANAGSTIGNYNGQAQFTDVSATDNILTAALSYENSIGNFNGASNGYQGNISGVLVFNRELNPTEKGQMNTWIHSNFGI